MTDFKNNLSTFFEIPISTKDIIRDLRHLSFDIERKHVNIYLNNEKVKALKLNPKYNFLSEVNHLVIKGRDSPYLVQNLRIVEKRTVFANTVFDSKILFNSLVCIFSRLSAERYNIYSANYDLTIDGGFLALALEVGHIFSSHIKTRDSHHSSGPIMTSYNYLMNAE